MIPLDQITGAHTTLTSLLAAINKDAINGTFELLAGLFVLNHCRVLSLHKQVRGVSLASVAFFTLWGMWNMYYYPALNQPISFYGGVFVVAANAIYLGMMFRYNEPDRIKKARWPSPREYTEPPKKVRLSATFPEPFYLFPESGRILSKAEIEHDAELLKFKKRFLETNHERSRN